jgi:hypothetical protein
MIAGRFRAIGLVLLVGAAPGLAQAPTELRLTGLNKTYSDLTTEVAPIRMDPVVVHLSSPRHSIVLKENRIRLTPLGDGRFRARTELDVLGKGDLVADVDLAGGTRRLTDEVVLPPQTVAVEGIVKLARGEGGYVVTTEELPKELPVAIRSRMVGDILSLCAGASLLTLGSLDCDPMAQALENPRLPLPPPGSQFLLADADLTAEDRAAIDALLAP